MEISSPLPQKHQNYVEGIGAYQFGHKFCSTNTPPKIESSFFGMLFLQLFWWMNCIKKDTCSPL